MHNMLRLPTTAGPTWRASRAGNRMVQSGSPWMGKVFASKMLSWGVLYLFHVRYDDPKDYRCNEHDAGYQKIESHGSLPFLLFQDGNNEELLPACFAWHGSAWM
jgi:hypothetical protein